MKVGMDTCSSGEPRTQGMSIPGKGCVDYSIHISDSVHDESPPWNDHIVRFPPPASALLDGVEELTCGSDVRGRVTQGDIEEVIKRRCRGDGVFDGNAHIGPLYFDAEYNINPWAYPKYDQKWCE